MVRQWLKSLLIGRSFKVSRREGHITGVPQVSVLGPLLFSSYTSFYHFYANDSQFTSRSNLTALPSQLVFLLAFFRHDLFDYSKSIKALFFSDHF